MRLSHVGWDHGAIEIARRLADAFGAPLHAGRYSRLWVDLNRAEHNPAVVPHVAFGADVPGNVSLSAADRENRIRRDHRPYREAVQRDVHRRIELHGRCLHVPVHSFTPELNGNRRPYEVGILYDPAHALESKLAQLLLGQLRDAGIEVRLNEPYLGTDDGIATWLRGVFAPDRYAGVELETSHAVTESPGGIERVSTALIAALPKLLEALQPRV